MEALLLLAAAGAAYVFFTGGIPTVSSENDEGTDQEGVIVTDVSDASSVQMEAFQHGQSIGLITVESIGGNFFLRQDAAQSFKRLWAAASVANITLQVDSAFRDNDKQTELYFAYQLALTAYKSGIANQPSPVAKPGFSNHQNGIAIDIAVQSSNTSPTYRWLADNAPPFGWTNVGATFHPQEFWHWEYSPEQDTYV